MTNLIIVQNILVYKSCSHLDFPPKLKLCRTQCDTSYQFRPRVHFLRELLEVVPGALLWGTSWGLFLGALGGSSLGLVFGLFLGALPGGTPCELRLVYTAV